MAPFTGDDVRAGQAFAMHHNASTNTCSQNHTKDHGRIFCGAIGRFGKGKTVGIVHHAYGAMQRGCKIDGKRLPIQPHRVGILYQPGARNNRAGNANAN